MEISVKTKNRIQICLHMFTHPGAPYFVNRQIYNTAIQVLDELFPVFY